MFEGVKKILVVDDSKAICISMQGELANQGYLVDTVNSGLEAIERVKANKYDLIFLDVVLPGMNGVEAGQFIKEYSPVTKIIFMSGYVGANFINNKIKHAPKEDNVIYLSKPFKENQIPQVSKEALNEKVSVLIRT